MFKIIMKKVPKKLEQKVQYEVIRNWSISYVESNNSNEKVKIFSARELLEAQEQKINDSSIETIVGKIPCKSFSKKRKGIRIKPHKK